MYQLPVVFVGLGIVLFLVGREVRSNSKLLVVLNLIRAINSFLSILNANDTGLSP